MEACFGELGEETVAIDRFEIRISLEDPSANSRSCSLFLAAEYPVPPAKRCRRYRQLGIRGSHITIRRLHGTWKPDQSEAAPRNAATVSLGRSTKAVDANKTNSSLYSRATADTILLNSATGVNYRLAGMPLSSQRTSYIDRSRTIAIGRRHRRQIRDVTLSGNSLCMTLQREAMTALLGCLRIGGRRGGSWPRTSLHAHGS